LSKLPTLSWKKVERALKKIGYVFDRQKGRQESSLPYRKLRCNRTDDSGLKVKPTGKLEKI
jgi:hypothetical protein